MTGIIDVEQGQPNGALERGRFSGERHDSDAARAYRQGAWLVLAGVLRRIKAFVREADEAARCNGDVVPGDVAQRVLNEFVVLYRCLETAIGDSSPADDLTKREIGRRVQEELLPYILLAKTAERCLSKPRGYAGDYWTIELTYRNQADGWGRVGRLLDRWVLESPPAAAVRNRRELMSEQIRMTVEARPGAAVEITSLACGPAEEVFDALQQLGGCGHLHVTLVDFDYEALAFVAAKREALQLQRAISLVDANLVHVALGRTALPVEDQDLVYTIGVIDYFSDDLVVKLLNAVHGMLRPGGRVIVGNFHPRNPFKAFMDRVLEWELTHRTERDLDRLLCRSRFCRPSGAILYEPQRINILAECVKA